MEFFTTSVSSMCDLLYRIVARSLAPYDGAGSLLFLGSVSRNILAESQQPRANCLTTPWGMVGFSIAIALMALPAGKLACWYGNRLAMLGGMLVPQQKAGLAVGCYFGVFGAGMSLFD